MNKNLRSALRFAAYIRAMGDQPIPIRHRNPRQWALDLQRQHELLRQTVGSELAAAAKASARALIREQGYRQAAEETMPMHVTATEAGKPDVKPGRHDQNSGNPPGQPAPANSAKERKAIKRELYLCRRKLRHADYWSAVRHALHLGRDVRVFECEGCGGLHVGNDPMSPRTRQYRRARSRLQAIDGRLLSMKGEQVALIRERAGLLREIGEQDLSAWIVADMMECLRRLLKRSKGGTDAK